MTTAIVGSIVGLIALILVWLFSGFALTGLDDLDAPSLVIQLRKATRFALPATIIIAVAALWVAALSDLAAAKYLATLPVLVLMLHVGISTAFPPDYSTPRLLKNLGHANPTLRKQALELLMFRNLPAEQILPVTLGRLRDDPDARVRLAAAMLLTNFEHPIDQEMQQILMDALQSAQADRDEQVRHAARLGIQSVRNRRDGRPTTIPSTQPMREGP